VISFAATTLLKLLLLVRPPPSFLIKHGHGLIIDIVLPVIYEESSSMWQTSADGWVTTALLEAGVGLRDVWETVAGLYERVRHYSRKKGEMLMNRERRIESS
jgi:hypothetical protein